MKNLNQYIKEGLKVNSKSKFGKVHKYFPKTKKELEKIIAQLIKEKGNEADLNDIDTSKITDMSWLFNEFIEFNGDISGWNVSNVEDMHGMFYGSIFNGDISNWDVSNVKNMDSMFYNSKFNSDISNWDVSKVKKMDQMFAYSIFNGDISNWNVSADTSGNGIFYNSPLKNNLPKWY